MHGLPLLQGGPQRAMEPVLEVELAAPGDHVREQVAVEGGVLLQQGLEIQGPLGGDQLIQAHLVWCNRRPLFLYVSMIRIRAYVPDALENHCDTLNHTATADSTRHRYDLAMSETASSAPVVQSEPSTAVAEITAGYTFDEPAIELGVLMENDAPVPSAVVRIPLSMLNRHGLVAGATGTGKTKTLQLMAEQISAAGVPVFAADIKGDLSGIAAKGSPSPKLVERAEEIGLTRYGNTSFPTAFWDIFGKDGHPVRATVQEMGPLLLARLMELTEPQEGVLNIAFRWAEDQRAEGDDNMSILDLRDLRSVIDEMGKRASSLRSKYGHVATSTVGVIQRRLLVLEEQGAASFFGEPALDIMDFLKVDSDGRGIVNVLAAEKLMETDNASENWR